MNNEPAFPVDLRSEALGLHPGMSLRDYFAAKAMQAQIAKHPVLSSVPLHELAMQASLHARGAYIYADAMLEERTDAAKSPHSQESK